MPLFVLLPGKSGETCNRFFYMVKKLCLTLDPESLMINFEKESLLSPRYTPQFNDNLESMRFKCIQMFFIILYFHDKIFKSFIINFSCFIVAF